MPRKDHEFRFSTFFDVVMPPRYEGTLWHYTTAEGVLGILMGQALWASSASQLNDRDEFQHGLGLIEERWASFKKRSIENRDLIDEWIRQAHAQLNASVLADSYLLCGTTDGQSQPQFLMYGSYAVGVNGAMPLAKEVLTPQLAEQSYSESGQFTTGWRHVIYDDLEKRDHVDRLLGTLGDLALIQTKYPPKQTQSWEIAVECVFRSAAYMKDNTFAHEKEVRLYGRADATRADVSFRIGKYGIVPYMKVGLSREASSRGFPIQEVAIGPGLLEPASAKTGLRIALDRHGYRHVPIVDRIGGRRA